MKESIKIIAIDGTDGDEIEIEIEFADDVITVIDCTLDKVLFSCDWSANLAPVFERALALWPVLEADD